MNRGPRGGRPDPPAAADRRWWRTPHGVELECLVTGAGRPGHGVRARAGPGASPRPGRSAAASPAARSSSSSAGTAGRARRPGRGLRRPGPRPARGRRPLRRDPGARGEPRRRRAVPAARRQPDRFERVVFFLPAVLRRAPRPDAARSGSPRCSAAAERAGRRRGSPRWSRWRCRPPCAATPAGWAYLRQRVDQLMRDGLAAGLADLAEPGRRCPTAVAALRAVTADALVIGCHGDDLHPVAVAEELAAALPATRPAHVRPPRRALERARRPARRAIADASSTASRRRVAGMGVTHHGRTHRLDLADPTLREWECTVARRRPRAAASCWTGRPSTPAAAASRRTTACCCGRACRPASSAPARATTST